MEVTEKHSKLYYITFLQVIGPILVIVGHMINGMPENKILQSIKDFIYVFHMPLFFFISGYLFSYKNGLKGKKYTDFIKKKAWRLLLPYFAFNILFIIPKVLVSNFIVDKVEFSFGYFLSIFLQPRLNVWGHLWFLFALFIIFAISPIWDFILKKKNRLIWGLTFLILIGLNLFPINTNILAIRDLCKDTLFFALGMLLATIGGDKIKNACTKRNFIYAVIIYFIAFIAWCFKHSNLTNMILCTLDILMLFLLPIMYDISSKKLDQLGNYSFSIYIMHWPVMLVIRILFYQILNWNPILVSFLMIIGGYFIPLLIIKIVTKIKETKNIKSKSLYYLLGI